MSDDRKSRINKLSERFKGRVGRPKQLGKDRERRSYYLDTEVAEQVDKGYKDFNHHIYPHSVSKSVFIDTILEYGLSNIESIKNLILTKTNSESDGKE
jgi:hypothetical protein